MKSMTGHGRGDAVAKGVRAVVECFSVNRKQGEVSVAVARELGWMEPRVREEVLKRVARGKVQVSIVLEQSFQSGAVLIDQARAAGFLREARALQKKLGLPGEVTLETVLAAPGVLQAGDEAARDSWPLVKSALDAALQSLLGMRAREGAHLKKELARVAGRMAGLVRRIRRLAPQVPVRQRENLLRRLESAHLPVDVLDPRVATEIAVFAERCDITEEMERLESHLGQFREKLEADGPTGRTLEFLAQEMGREWNTTGSKANDAEISRLVVEAKAELDRIREQLANIE
jgi:uncharacterized protein (TIGR00255 family)